MGAIPATVAALAGRADVAVVFAYDQESEGTGPHRSRAAGGPRISSSRQVAQANTSTIVVLDTRRSGAMPWLNQVAGVLEGLYPGQEYGAAIAALLFGDVNPCGQLPQTFPGRHRLPTANAGPVARRERRTGPSFKEGLDVGYRWYDANNVDPLFPFGYGLSYTRFRFQHLKVRRTGTPLSVTFTVEHGGPGPGGVAQLYLGGPASAGEPPHQLKGFQRVVLRPRQSTRVALTLTTRSFAYWDATAKAWAVAPGLYRLLVGSSSRDIRLHGFIRQQ